MVDWKKTTTELMDGLTYEYYEKYKDVVWVREDKIKEVLREAWNDLHELDDEFHYNCWEEAHDDIIKKLGLLENDMGKTPWTPLDVETCKKRSGEKGVARHSVSSPKKPLWKELDDKKVFDLPKKCKVCGKKHPVFKPEDY